MNRLRAALVDLLAAVRRHGRDAALVGGLAVSARAEPRLTRDVDLAVAVASDAETEALVRALVSDGYQTLAAVEQERTRRLATVRVRVPGNPPEGIVGDLLFASSGIEPEIVAAAEPLELFSGVVVPVARTGHLIALKLLARDDRERPQDLVDLNGLFAVAEESELRRARDAVERIEAAGFSRGRDLVAALERWMREKRR